jgi:hypothetical protein
MKIKFGFGYLLLAYENNAGFNRRFEISLSIYGKKWYRFKRKIRKLKGGQGVSNYKKSFIK